MATFTHSSGQYLSVDDAEIYFEIIGNPIGHPLLLLHGGLGNLTDFNGIAAQLASEFRLIGVDFRGHGKSTLGKSRLTYQRYQADVEAILAYLNIDCFSILGFLLRQDGKVSRDTAGYLLRPIDAGSRGGSPEAAGIQMHQSGQVAFEQE